MKTSVNLSHHWPMNDRSPFYWPILMYGFVFLSAVLMGGLIGLGAYVVILVFVATGMGAIMLLFPMAAVWAIFIGALVVSGLVELYLPKLQLIRWAFAGLSIAVAGIAFVKWMNAYRLKDSIPVKSNSLGICLFVFFLCCLVSILAGELTVRASVIGLKNYFQMWGLMLAMAWLGYSPKQASRLFKALCWLSLIQLPFVLHQFLFLVPLRSSDIAAAHNIVAVDIVAGTFGGELLGGGRSPDLALLVAIAIVLFFCQYRYGKRSLSSTIALSAVAFAPILFNEAKLIIVIFPVGFFLVFPDKIIRHPIKSIFTAVGLITVLIGLLIGYSMLPGAKSQQYSSFGKYMDENIAYNAGDKGYGSAVLNRSSVYPFWLNEQIRYSDFTRMLFGHGVGITNPVVTSDNASSTTDTLLNIRYSGFAIGLTGFSSLLWETGLIGTLSFLGILISAYLLGKHLLEYWKDSEHEPLIKAAQISVVLVGVTLLHNNYLQFDLGFQALMCVTIGYLLAMAQAKREA